MFRLITWYSFAAGGSMTKPFEMVASHLHTILEHVQKSYLFTITREGRSVDLRDTLLE